MPQLYPAEDMINNVLQPAERRRTEPKWKNAL